MRLSFTARPVPALATPRQAPAGAFPPGQVGPVRLASGPQPSGYPRYPAPVTVQTTYSRPEAQTYRPPERRAESPLRTPRTGHRAVSVSKPVHPVPPVSAPKQVVGVLDSSRAYNTVDTPRGAYRLVSTPRGAFRAIESPQLQYRPRARETPRAAYRMVEPSRARMLVPPRVPTGVLRAATVDAPRHLHGGKRVQVFTNPIPSSPGLAARDERRMDVLSTYRPERGAPNEGQPIKVVQALEHALRGATEQPENAVVTYVTEGQPVLADLSRYWDKRRVFMSIRRIAEAIEDQDADAKPDFDAFFARLSTGLADGDASGGPAEDASGLTEEAFVEQLKRLGTFPAEMTASDAQEVFAALTLRSIAVSQVWHARRQAPPRLTKEAFVSCLRRAPYTVPDFPVPTHKLEPSPGIDSVLDEVWGFLSSGRFMDTVHDFTLSGLVSAEEIQALLPTLRPLAEVEKAVVRLISVALPLFPADDWQKFVYGPGGLPRELWDPLAVMHPVAENPTLDSPATQYRSTHAAGGPKKGLVDWWSCQRPAAVVEGGLPNGPPGLGQVVLELHPADTTGPFLISALVHAARLFNPAKF